MAKTDKTRQKIRSTISAIKRINDDPKSLVDNVYDAHKDDLESVDGLVKKGINSFTSKLKGRTENKKDIFGEIVETAEGFLGTDKEDPINPKKKPLIKSKILKYSKQSVHKTLQVSKQIVLDNVQKILFGGLGGQGICDSNTTIGVSSLTISPKEFDFLNMLKVDPTSISGKLMYESTTDLGLGGIKFNRELYENFDLTTPPYYFQAKDGSTLFTLSWDPGTQLYTVGGLDPAMNLPSFLEYYYSTIEYANLDDILKTAMLMTLQGDGSESISFNEGMNMLNRLCTKLFSICGNSANQQPMANNAVNQLNEDEMDIQNYFDFDDIEGIDLDDEDSKLRRVLKFRDCNNFEIPINSNHIEDFAYMSDMKTSDENIQNTLNKAAGDAYEQAGGTVYFDGFQLSLTGSYIMKVPRALISAILSPKMFFPIAVSYKLVSQEVLTVKNLIKKLYNLFYKIIRDIFWVFIKEFWGFIKRDLLEFIRTTAERIAINKLKKYKAIVLSLINLLTKILQTGIGSCEDIFNAILGTISMALNKPIKIPIPGLLLVLAEQLPGFSSDRAYMDAIERMEVAGINTGPIYGSENKTPAFIKSIIDAYSGEMDSNSFVKIALKPAIIPAGPGGAVISPLIEGVGKLF